MVIWWPVPKMDWFPLVAMSQGGLQWREAYLCFMPVTKSRLQKETGSLLELKVFPFWVDFCNIFGVHACQVSFQTNVTLHLINNQVAATIVVVPCGKASLISLRINIISPKNMQQDSSVQQNTFWRVVKVVKIKRTTLWQLVFSATVNAIKGKSQWGRQSIKHLFKSGYSKGNGILEIWDADSSWPNKLMHNWSECDQ